MSVVQVKPKPASVALQAPPWNSLLRLFSCVATRSVHKTKGIELKMVKHMKFLSSITSSMSFLQPSLVSAA